MLHDITRPLGPSTPAWPGDQRFSLRWTADHGSGAAVSAIELSPHLGTHFDAPFHLDPTGADAAHIPLDACNGRCVVLDLRAASDTLEPADLPPPRRLTPRVLLATGRWPALAPLPERWCGLSVAAVDALAAAGVRLVGVDGPSVDPPGAGLAAHRRCLEHGITILEGLDLDGVAAGRYSLIALPLRLEGVEASPARAVLVVDQTPRG